ncbi:hypothetical protein QBC39DRAFT_162398 [Podospora conica]|nr:hypothetical protein QBC39DRAFT_162398 [Schizothecium conicum]
MAVASIGIDHGHLSSFAMSLAPQPSAAPVAAPAPVAQHQLPPPTPLQTGTPTLPSHPPHPPHPPHANGSKSNAVGGHTAQMASVPPATATAAAAAATAVTAGTPAVSGQGQTAAPVRPVVKMKRTGHQGPFPATSSSLLASGVGPRPNLQNLTNPKPPAASPSSSVTRNRPPSHARQSHAGPGLNSVATSLSGNLRLSSSASPSPDLDPHTLSSRPPMASSRLADRPRWRPSASRRDTSSRESSPDLSHKTIPKPTKSKPSPVQQPLGRDTPGNSAHHEALASQIQPSPFRNSGRTAPKPEPHVAQTPVATPAGPPPATPAINPKTNKVYTSRDAIDDPEYKEYLQTDDPPNTDGNTRGALIPAKYRKSNDAQYPWICPVRSCRSKHEILSGLGAHFTASTAHAHA